MCSAQICLQRVELRGQLPIVQEGIRGVLLLGTLIHEEDAELVAQALVVRLLVVLEVLGILKKLAELI